MADTATPTPPPAPSAPPPPPGNGGLGFEIPKNFDEAKKLVIDSQLWRSVFRGGVWKDTPRDRASHIIGNVWLHLHPIRVRKRALEWTYSWGLGGLSFAMFLIL